MAQTLSGFNKKDFLINIGTNIGAPYFGTGYTASSVNPALALEIGFTDDLSMGLQGALNSVTYFSSSSFYAFKQTALYLGPRASYHFGRALDLDANTDVYAGATIGYLMVSTGDSNAPTGYSDSLGSSGIGGGAYVGGKYYLFGGVGVHAELGYQSTAFASFGLSFRF